MSGVSVKHRMDPALIHRVRELVSEGMSQSQVAAALGVSPAVVWTHVHATQCVECGWFFITRVAATECLSCRKTRWRPNEILNAINRFYVQHGRPPTAIDWWTAAPDRPSANNVKFRFGTFNAGIKAAGFKPRRIGSQLNPNGGSKKKVARTVANGYSAAEELAYLIDEQERDIQTSSRVFHHSIDALSDRYNRGSVSSDGWKTAVHWLIDRRRQIDAWAEAA